MTEEREQADLKTPFTFKLMVLLVAVYLGWRLVQGVVWLWEWVF